MFEKEINRKVQEKHKAEKRRERSKQRKKPCYKGYHFKNWLVYPIGVICTELDLAEDRKYQALSWSEEKAFEIVCRYLIDICEYDEEAQELNFSTDWHRPWEAHASKKDKQWCKKFNYELTQYLKDHYEIPGFKKSLGDGYESDWITFTKI